MTSSADFRHSARGLAEDGLEHVVNSECDQGLVKWGTKNKNN